MGVSVADRRRGSRPTRHLGWRVLGLALESYRVGGPSLLLQLARSRKAAAWIAVLVVAGAALLIIWRLVVGANGVYTS